MLKRLDTPYIDLLLLHQPFGDVLGAWKDMEKAVELGKVKSIGLSNFEEYHFEDIMENAKIKPVLMQVECHPYYQQVELKEKLDKYDIVIPGAHNPDYIKENINVFDFELSNEEMEAMKNLDKKQRFFISFEGAPYEQIETMLTGTVLPD